MLYLSGSAAGETPPEHDFLDMDLLELMSVQVSSVSKKNETISDAPGAVFVITGEDIRRSGVTSIPEALRMAPGVQVNRIDASKWAITVRGFNGRFANKLLVLMDGRTIYTPLFSGVFWEVQDYPLSDIDRIEVIRGGAGTLWGANAVNGVINIITKNAQNTQGGLLSAGAGTEERGSGSIRYGGEAEQDLFYRFYGKSFYRDSSARESGGQADDAWNMSRGGFRVDWLKSEKDTFSFHGDYYSGETGQKGIFPDLAPPDYVEIVKEDVDVRGGNLFFRWQKEIDQTSDFALQVYYDYTRRREYAIEGRRNTVDVDFQHRFAPFSGHELLWGAGYRCSADYLKQPAYFMVTDDRRTDDLYSGFIQDEISFLDDHLRLIIGGRIEHNNYTGYEVQPSVRTIYNTGSGKTFWAAWSRGVRTPSRMEHTVSFDQQTLPPNYLFPGAPASRVLMTGNDDYDSEEVIAYEVGFRSQLSKAFFMDLSFFYNEYDHMLSSAFGAPAPPLFDLPNDLGNDVDGSGYGAELASTWDVTSKWRLTASYSFMTLDLDANQSDTPVEVLFEDDIPSHQFSIRSLLDLPAGFEFDGWLRYVDVMDSYDLDSYFSLDLRLGWQASDTLEFSLVGQNLLDGSHPEYGASTILNTEVTEVERNIYAEIRWRF